ncbi:MAG: triose-phosphate isomerase [Candidatus Woesearchaeota archaeon]
MLKTPLLIVNFKAYPSAIGRQAVQLASVCEKIARKFGIEIAVATQSADICAVSDKVTIPVLAQHVDPFSSGPHTGSIIPLAVKAAGATGTFLNHSEKRMAFKELTIANMFAKKAGLQTIIFAASPAKAVKAASLKPRPDFIAIEPPELIGGKRAVSQAKPEVITATTQRITNIPIICGAGIKTAEDVRKAIKLGAVGVAVASGVVLSKSPEGALRELALGLLG